VPQISGIYPQEFRTFAMFVIADLQRVLHTCTYIYIIGIFIIFLKSKLHYLSPSNKSMDAMLLFYILQKLHFAKGYTSFEHLLPYSILEIENFQQCRSYLRNSESAVVF
jgi:hypothetical protein